MHMQHEQSKVIDVGVYIYVYVCVCVCGPPQKMFNHTLAIDSPSQWDFLSRYRLPQSLRNSINAFLIE